MKSPAFRGWLGDRMPEMEQPGRQRKNRVPGAGRGEGSSSCRRTPELVNWTQQYAGHRGLWGAVWESWRHRLVGD